MYVPYTFNVSVTLRLTIMRPSRQGTYTAAGCISTREFSSARVVLDASFRAYRVSLEAYIRAYSISAAKVTSEMNEWYKSSVCPSDGRWQVAVGIWHLAVGSWQLAVLLAVGSWQGEKI